MSLFPWFGKTWNQQRPGDVSFGGTNNVQGMSRLEEEKRDRGAKKVTVEDRLMDLLWYQYFMKKNHTLMHYVKAIREDSEATEIDRNELIMMKGKITRIIVDPNSPSRRWQHFSTRTSMSSIQCARPCSWSRASTCGQWYISSWLLASTRVAESFTRLPEEGPGDLQSWGCAGCRVCTR